MVYFPAVYPKAPYLTFVVMNLDTQVCHLAETGLKGGRGSCCGQGSFGGDGRGGCNPCRVVGCWTIESLCLSSCSSIHLPLLHAFPNGVQELVSPRIDVPLDEPLEGPASFAISRVFGEWTPVAQLPGVVVLLLSAAWFVFNLVRERGVEP